MHRCFVDSSEWAGAEIGLSAAEEHHLIHVLRAGAGDTVAVLDGRGREATASVDFLSPRAGKRGGGAGRGVRLRLLSEPVLEPPLSPRIVLLQAIPKGSRMDWIVEKATEMGVAEIVPVLSARVAAPWNAKQRAAHQERWRRVAIGAAKQSGVRWIPELRVPMEYDGVAEALRGLDLAWVGSLGKDAKPFREVLRQERSRRPERIGILIGPEGDLTPEEMECAVKAGAVPVSFGPNTLRVETAAMFAVSVLVYEFRDLAQGAARLEGAAAFRECPGDSAAAGAMGAPRHSGKGQSGDRG